MLLLLVATIFLISLVFWFISKHGERKNPNKVYVCFFHPNCDAGGGGERVLWSAIEALQLKYDHIECCVYSVPGLNWEDLQNSVYLKFKIKIGRRVRLVPIQSHFLLKKGNYPCLTVLWQNVMSLLVGLEGQLRLSPDVFIDTMGFPLTALWLALFSRSTRKAAYVHYPIVSADMLSRVQSTPRKPALLKIAYYKLLMLFYGMVGNCCFDCVMVNSTWTQNHILALWGNPESTWILYPPCATDEFATLPPTRGLVHRLRVASLAQFRPEKNLELQISAMSHVVSKFPEARLVLVGGVRNREDQCLVERLGDYAGEIGVGKNVEFRQNVSFDELKEILSSCSVGLHSMVEEHFGIGVVECMAAGLVVVAHDSGGPRLDIIRHGEVGFRAGTTEEYAERIAWIMAQPMEEMDAIRREARLWALDHFSAGIFRTQFIQIFDSALLTP